MTAPTRTIRRSRGIALVAVLWVTVLAALLLLGLQRVVRTHLALSYGDLSAVQAHWLARAGVEQALAVLEDDGRDADSPSGKWYDNPELFQDVALGGGKFAVTSRAEGWPRPGLRDEAAYLNLNAADAKQLAALPEMTEDRANAILDWRDKTEMARPGGAGAAYYANLKFPYLIRRGSLQTHRELLLVRGFEDPAFFGTRSGELAADGPAAFTTVYSYTVNRDASGEPRVNINTVPAETLQQRFDFSPALAQAVVQQRGRQQYQSLTGLLDVQPAVQPSAPGGDGSGRQVTRITAGWLGHHLEDLATTDEQRLPARININTAPREVLMTLPEVTADIADAIVARRTSSAGAFRSVGDLLDAQIITEQSFRAVADQLTVRSNVFTIQSAGWTDRGVRRKILAVVDRASQPMSILYWYQSE